MCVIYLSYVVLEPIYSTYRFALVEKNYTPLKKQREAAAPDGLQCEILHILIEGRPVFFFLFFVEMKPSKCTPPLWVGVVFLRSLPLLT